MTKPHRLLTAALVFFLSIGSADLVAQSLESTRQSGPVSVRVSLTPAAAVIGDTLTLEIRVEAEKDVEVLMPDFGDALDRFTIRDYAPRESIDSHGNLTSIQTYRLDPPSSGKQVIPPILIEYVDRRDGQREAPEGFDAYEVLTDRIAFEVGSVLPDDAKSELMPPMEALQLHEPESETDWVLPIAVLAAAVLSSPFLYRAFVAARRRRRRKSAYEVAKSRLAKLLDSPRQSSEQVDQFYVGLSYVIRQYIEDRFEMRAPELTTEEFLSSIGNSPDFSPDHQGLLREFLRRADLVKFARVEPSSGETDNAIASVTRFLEETRENAPLLEEESGDG